MIIVVVCEVCCVLFVLPVKPKKKKKTPLEVAGGAAAGGKCSAPEMGNDFAAFVSVDSVRVRKPGVIQGAQTAAFTA